MIRSKHLLSVIFAAAFAPMPIVAHEHEQGHDMEAGDGAIVLTDSVAVTATILDIKKPEREITLRDEEGTEYVMVAGEEVRNFDQIMKGDVVVVEYHRAIASALEKMSDVNVASQANELARTPAGSKPGLMAMQTSSIVATVLEIDKPHRLISVQGPRGGIAIVSVPADITAFDGLEKGDKISAVMSEAVAISVHSPDSK